MAKMRTSKIVNQWIDELIDVFSNSLEFLRQVGALYDFMDVLGGTLSGHNN